MVYVLLVVVLLGWIASLWLKIVFAQAVLVTKQERGVQGRAVAEAAYMRAFACLARLQTNTCSPPAGCDVACGAPCSQFFGAYDLNLGGISYNVSVTLSGTFPNCAVTASCNNCTGS